MKRRRNIAIAWTVALSLLFCVFSISAVAGTVDPCALVELETVQAVFPVVKGMETKSYGPNENCNYLDELNLPALTVTIGQDPAFSAHAMMENLGDGYRVVDVPGLGDEAAMAVTRGNPEYNIKGGMVAELYIRKGRDFLLLAPMRVEVKADGADFEKFRHLAEKMLGR